MKKKLCVLCLIICITFAFAACESNQQASSKTEWDHIYEVKLLNKTDSSLFRSDVKYISSFIDSNDEIVNPKAEKAKEITICENKYSLHYSKSLDTGTSIIDIYESEDKKYECRFNSSKNRLNRIVANTLGEDYFAPLKTEDDYVDWCKKLLEQYGIDDLSKFEYSCETGVVVSGENFTRQDIRPYFCEAGKTDGEVSLYRFYFRRYVDLMPTADCYSFYIRPKTGLLIVRFSAELFAETSTINADEEQIKTAIDSFLNEYKNDKYSISSYNIEQYRLSYIDNRLCCVCSVAINYSNNDYPSYVIRVGEALVVCLDV